MASGDGNPLKRGHTDDYQDDIYGEHGAILLEDVEDDATAGALVPVPKKPRNELIAAGEDRNKALTQQNDKGRPRTSNLEAPIMLLSGHKSEVYCCKFHPDGQTIASAGHDRDILFWRTYGECENFATIPAAHKSAILDLDFSSDGDYLFTCSVDKTVIQWDAKTGAKMKRYKGHQNFINALDVSRKDTNLLVTGSDDYTVRVWDTRIKKPVSNYKDSYQITAVTFNEDANQIIFGGIDPEIRVYDMRKNDVAYKMPGHFDSITGLTLSPDGFYVLSNSMDNSCCVWDIRPYAPQDRCVKTLQGHQHNFEKNLLRCSWSPDGTRVTAGSADRHVYIWEVSSRRVLYKLPGHKGSVNEVVFHPEEPIVLSGSSDKTLYLGEIEPQS